MSINSTQTQSVSVGGISISGTVTRTADAQIGNVTTLPAAKSGTLSTRTSDTAGTLTLGSGHGITTGSTINIYWSGGVRYGVTVGTVSGTSVPFTSGNGDNLPIATTVITAATVVEIDIDVDGDLVQLLALSCNKKCHVDIQESDNSQIVGISLAANEPVVWIADLSIGANPLAGAVVAKIITANGETAEATLKIGMLYES